MRKRLRSFAKTQPAAGPFEFGEGPTRPRSATEPQQRNIEFLRHLLSRFGATGIRKEQARFCQCGDRRHFLRTEARVQRGEDGAALGQPREERKDVEVGVAPACDPM